MGGNNLHKSIIDHAPVGYLYSTIMYDENGDPEDYQIVEANKYFASMVGLETEDLIGKKISRIYEDIKTDKSSWEEVYNNIIDHYKKKDFEYYCKFIDKHYRVKSYNPKEGHLITYFINLTKDQEDTKERILYSTIEFTQELLTNKDHYSALSNGIEMLGNAAKVDRVYYWENHYDQQLGEWFTSQKIEWCLGNVHQQIDNPELQNVPFEEVGDFIGPLSQNKSFNSHIKDIDSTRSRTKQMLEDQGILSILVLPVFVKGVFRGFIGFDSCKAEKEWSHVEISLLNSFILLYVKSIERNILEKRLVQANKNVNNFFHMVQDLLFVLDFEGKIIGMNQTALERLHYSREELLGKHISLLHPQDKAKEVEKNLQDFIEGEIDYCNMLALTKNGEMFPVEIKVSEGLWDKEKALFAVSKDRTELSMSEEKFSKAFNNSGVSMFITKFEDGEFLEVNDTFLDLIGYKKEDILGKNILDIKMVKGLQNREIFTKEIEAHKKILDMEIEISTKDNGSRTGLLNVVPLNMTNEVWLLSSIIDITKRIQYEEKILELSNRDYLTGIYNRRFLYQRAEEILEEYKRNGKDFSISIIDIDDFKAINDSFGHQAGDGILKEFTKIVGENLRIYDILGRYGGEEFIIIFNNSNKENSKIVLERISNLVNNTIFTFGNHHIQLSFSAGVSNCKELSKDEITIDKLVDLADKRMYIAKNRGKNTIVAR